MVLAVVLVVVAASWMTILPQPLPKQPQPPRRLVLHEAWQVAVEDATTEVRAVPVMDLHHPDTKEVTLHLINGLEVTLVNGVRLVCIILRGTDLHPLATEAILLITNTETADIGGNMDHRTVGDLLLRIHILMIHLDAVVILWIIAIIAEGRDPRRLPRDRGAALPSC